jgi:hypothetical protein
LVIGEGVSGRVEVNRGAEVTGLFADAGACGPVLGGSVLGGPAALPATCSVTVSDSGDPSSTGLMNWAYPKMPATVTAEPITHQRRGAFRRCRYRAIIEPPCSGGTEGSHSARPMRRECLTFQRCHASLHAPI